MTPHQEHGFRLAAAVRGVPSAFLRHGTFRKDANTGRYGCAAAALACRSIGDYPELEERLVKVAHGKSWTDEDAALAEDVREVMVKYANPMTWAAGLLSSKGMPDQVSGLSNIFSQALAASAIGGASIGALNWHARRNLEKEDKSVEEERAKHLMLRQMIGDIDSRVRAREMGEQEKIPV